jgi:hypothetical protein
MSEAIARAVRDHLNDTTGKAPDAAAPAKPTKLELVQQESLPPSAPLEASALPSAPLETSAQPEAPPEVPDEWLSPGTPDEPPRAPDKPEPTATPEPELSLSLDDIDASFDAIFGEPTQSDAPPPRGGNEADQAEMAELFRQIAATYLAPIRDFMVALDMEESVPREWLEMCTPAVASLARSAQSSGLVELSLALSELEQAFLRAERGFAGGLVEADREALTNAYRKLVDLLPLAFNVEEERDRREPIIVQSLLRQVPDVRKVALDKLYAAGLTTLRMYYVAKPADISEAAGLPLALARRIVQRFAEYKRGLAAMAPSEDRSAEHARLEKLRARLELHHRDLEEKAAGQSAKDRSRMRQARSDTMLEINVLLARLGEIGLVERLERLPFQRKVAELAAYLETMQARAPGRSGA